LVEFLFQQVDSRPYTYYYLQKNYMPNLETMICL
jgi:hypothetical protein